MADKENCYRQVEVFWTFDETQDEDILGQKPKRPTPKLTGTKNAIADPGNRRPSKPKPKAAGKKTREVRAAIPKKQPVVQNIPPKVPLPKPAVETADRDTLSLASARSKASLKDLCADDKQRVANLIKELARLGSERESMVHVLQSERQIFERRVTDLQTEQKNMMAGKQDTEQQLAECQALLAKYQSELLDQQEKSRERNRMPPPGDSRHGDSRHGDRKVPPGQRGAELYTPKSDRRRQASARQDQSDEDAKFQQTPQPDRRSQHPQAEPRQTHRTSGPSHAPNQQNPSHAPIQQDPAQREPFSEPRVSTNTPLRHARPPESGRYYEPRADTYDHQGPAHDPQEADLQDFSRRPFTNKLDEIIAQEREQQRDSADFRPLHPDPSPRSSPGPPSDEPDFLAYYASLGPDEKRRQLTQQKQQLVAEQQRLRSVLEEQETLLHTKQTQLHRQQALQRQRLAYFEQNGTFPPHHVYTDTRHMMNPAATQAEEESLMAGPAQLLPESQGLRLQGPQIGLPSQAPPSVHSNPAGQAEVGQQLLDILGQLHKLVGVGDNRAAVGDNRSAVGVSQPNSSHLPTDRRQSVSSDDSRWERHDDGRVMTDQGQAVTPNTTLDKLTDTESAMEGRLAPEYIQPQAAARVQGTGTKQQQIKSANQRSAHGTSANHRSVGRPSANHRAGATGVRQEGIWLDEDAEEISPSTTDTEGGPVTGRNIFRASRGGEGGRTRKTYHKTSELLDLVNDVESDMSLLQDERRPHRQASASNRHPAAPQAAYAAQDNPRSNRQASASTRHPALSQAAYATQDNHHSRRVAVASNPHHRSKQTRQSTRDESFTSYVESYTSGHRDKAASLESSTVDELEESQVLDDIFFVK